MSDQAHSILGASSMYRWGACPGSVRVVRHLPSVTSSYSEAGVFAHDIAAKVLTGSDFPPDCSDEMREAVKLYVDLVIEDYLYADAKRTKSTAGVIIELPQPHATSDRFLVEHRFDLSKIIPEGFGTGDAVTWHEHVKLLRVYDFKYGSGHVVEVEKNEQFLYYALGALVSLGFPAKWIECVVVQPRAKHRRGPIRRWRFAASEILDFEADLVEKAARTRDPNAPLVPGSHCFFCPGRQLDKCPALKEKRQKEAESLFTPIVDPCKTVADDIFS